LIDISKVFKNTSALKAEVIKDIKRKIDNTLKNEVSQITKEIIQEHIQTDVYNAGSPRVYVRRYYDGGLIDERNLVTDVKDNTLTITDVAKFNPIGTTPSSSPDELTRQIVEGYGSKKTWYSQPRPFMENANIELENNNDVQKAIDDGLARQGIRRIRSYGRI